MALNVTRDFIPAEKARTPLEAERSKMLREMGAGKRADFRPGPDHKLLSGSGSEAQADEAMDRAMAAQASAARQDYQAAVERLKKLNVANAIEAIMQAPEAVAEMLLIAEVNNGNRSSVLQRFALPDPAAKARWDEILGLAPQVEKNSSNQSGGSFDEATKVTAEAKAEDAEV